MTILLHAKFLLALLPLTAVLALLPAQAAEAAKPRLVIGSPTKSATVVGNFPIRARLAVGGKSNVRRADFFLEGKLIRTDHKAPFRTTALTTFDTSALPTGANKLDFKVRITIRRKSGKLVKSTLRQSVPVEMFRPPSATAPLSATSWKLGFNDDFTSPAVSQTKWKTQRDDWIKHGIPYSNLEGAGYLTSNVKVANGSMNISTSSLPAGGQTQSTGSVNTNKIFSFKYGYMESRMLIPACAGCWPAFWMLPSGDYWPPEIDVIEYFDTSKQFIPYSAVHWATNQPDKEDFFSQQLGGFEGANYIGTWQTYGVLWTKDTVQFYLNGLPGPQFSVKKQIPHEPMYPIIQLAIGAGHRPAPSTMQVDYLRAWLPTR